MPTAREVKEMFGRIAERYDRLNRVLSLGRDVHWRRRLAGSLAGLGFRNGLDLCCGTGDVSLELTRHLDGLELLAAADFSLPMCRLARARTGGTPVAVACADGLALPFPDRAFDFVSVAFGVRNFEDLAAGLAEIARVVRPGGRVSILEFAPPTGLFLRLFYRPYLRLAVPLAGRLLAGSAGAYHYLSTSIQSFLTPEQMLEALARAGFSDRGAQRLTLGVTYLYTGIRRE